MQLKKKKKWRILSINAIKAHEVPEIYKEHVFFQCADSMQGHGRDPLF